MNLDFASVWEMISDIVPENDALICGDEIISWKDYDLQSSKIATALKNAGWSSRDSLDRRTLAGCRYGRLSLHPASCGNAVAHWKYFPDQGRTPPSSNGCARAVCVPQTLRRD